MEKTSFWKDKRVLVTGANGFAGSHLCYLLLEAGAKVRAFMKRGGDKKNLATIKNNINIVLGDVTDLPSLISASKNIDLVFHLAAVVPVMEAREVPQNSFQVNTIGTFNVAWASFENEVRRMVHISTCHVYGNQSEKNLPITEDTFPKPNDIYASSKYAAEIVLKPLINEGLDTVISRAFNHYGPWQIGDFFIPKVITQVLRSRNPVLGNPNPTRDYSYVKDIVKGYMLAAEFGKPSSIYNLCSGEEISMGELCHKIIELSGIKNVKPIWKSKRKLDISRSFGDYSKAKKELGWVPKMSLEEGLKKTIEWWKQHPKLLQKQ